MLKNQHFRKMLETNVGTSAGGKERQADGRKRRRKLRWVLVGWKLTCLFTFRETYRKPPRPHPGLLPPPTSPDLPWISSHLPATSQVLVPPPLVGTGMRSRWFIHTFFLQIYKNINLSYFPRLYLYRHLNDDTLPTIVSNNGRV
jgi:hypothetical protein